MKEIRVDFQTKTFGLISVILLTIRNYMTNFFLYGIFMARRSKAIIRFSKESETLQRLKTTGLEKEIS